MGLSRNKVAVPEGAAGTPPFWRDVHDCHPLLGMDVVMLALVLLVLLSLVCCAVYTPIQRESGNWVPHRRLFFTYIYKGVNATLV